MDIKIQFLDDELPDVVVIEFTDILMSVMYLTPDGKKKAGFVLNDFSGIGREMRYWKLTGILNPGTREDVIQCGAF
jgi:hypothetical protein